MDFKNKYRKLVESRIFTAPFATASTSRVGTGSSKVDLGLLFGPASLDWSHHFETNIPVIVDEFWFMI